MTMSIERERARMPVTLHIGSTGRRSTDNQLDTRNWLAHIALRDSGA
jgi:hypothetical protein